LLEKRRDRRHHPLSAPLASDVDVTVVRIPAEAMPALFRERGFASIGLLTPLRRLYPK
jgi:hypothetical protein